MIKQIDPIGPSDNSGANIAGRVRRHPILRVWEIRYSDKGPGCTAAAKPNEIAGTKRLKMLVPELIGYQNQTAKE